MAASMPLGVKGLCLAPAPSCHSALLPGHQEVSLPHNLGPVFFLITALQWRELAEVRLPSCEVSIRSLSQQQKV